MGLAHFLNDSVLQFLLPFTVEIIVLILLIVVLVYPEPLSSYLNVTNLESNPVNNSSLSNKVVNLSTKNRSVDKDFCQNTRSSEVLEVLNHSSSVLETFGSTLANLDKISSNRDHTNLKVKRELKPPFELVAVSNYIQDGGNETDFRIVEKTEEEPVSSVDSVHNFCSNSSFYVAPGNSDVSNTRDNHPNLNRLPASMRARHEDSSSDDGKTGCDSDFLPKPHYTVAYNGTSENANSYDDCVAFSSYSWDSNTSAQIKIDGKYGSKGKLFPQGSCETNCDKTFTGSNADVSVSDVGIIKQGEKIESNESISALLSDSKDTKLFCWTDIFTKARDYFSRSEVVVDEHCKATSEVSNNDLVDVFHVFSDSFMKVTRVPGRCNIQEDKGFSVNVAEKGSTSRSLVPTDITSQLEQILKEALHDVDLLNNLEASPFDINIPRRSLDSLKERIDLQDLYNMSNDVMQRNKKVFVEKVVNHSIMKNHIVPIEEIPVLKEAENTEVKSYQADTNVGTEDKFVNNSKLNVSNNSTKLEFCPRFNYVAHPANERLAFATKKLSFEHPNKKPQCNSFSNFSDWRRQSDVHSSIAQLYEDLFMKRHETIFNSINNDTIDQERKPCTQENKTNLLRREVNNMDPNKSNKVSGVYKASGNSLDNNPNTKDLLLNVCTEKNPKCKSRGIEQQTYNVGAKVKCSRGSLLKSKMPFLKTKSQEDSCVEDCQKSQDIDENSSYDVTSKCELKFLCSGSPTRENSTESQTQLDSQRPGSSKDKSSNSESDSNPFFKLLQTISRKFKGNSKNSREELSSNKPREQNKVNVVEGSEGRQPFPVKDPLVVERNVCSLDQFYSEPQCDHHRVDTPASGSCTDASTSLHCTTSLDE